MAAVMTLIKSRNFNSCKILKSSQDRPYPHRDCIAIPCKLMPIVCKA